MTAHPPVVRHNDPRPPDNGEYRKECEDAPPKIGPEATGELELSAGREVGFSNHPSLRRKLYEAIQCQQDKYPCNADRNQKQCRVGEHLGLRESPLMYEPLHQNEQTQRG